MLFVVCLRSNQPSNSTTDQRQSFYKNLDKHIQQKFYGLDSLRTLAISFVFFFHYFILSGRQPAWLPDAAKFGWTGVDLFFVLSGFLISSQLFAQIKQGKYISFKQFFLKRFFRIVPAFLVTVGLYVWLQIGRAHV